MPSPESTPTAQRQMMPEEEKDTQPLQTKPLAASMTPLAQRQAMPEEEKKEEPPVQRKPLAESITPLAPRQMIPEEERKEEKPVQPKSLLQRSAGEESVDAGRGIEQQLGQSSGKGSPLPESVRSYMEPRFGTDFSGVRVHTGSESQHLNRSLNAQAFTVGQDMYYGASKSPTDLRLTAHELTHVVQQTGGGTTQRKLARGEPDIFLRQGEYNPSSRAGQELLAHELTHVVQQDGEQLQRARTQAKEGAATGGAPSGREKGPVNFLSGQRRVAARPLSLTDAAPAAPGWEPGSQWGGPRSPGGAGRGVPRGSRPSGGPRRAGDRQSDQRSLDAAAEGGRAPQRLHGLGDRAACHLPRHLPARQSTSCCTCTASLRATRASVIPRKSSPNAEPDDIDLYRIGPQIAAAGGRWSGLCPRGATCRTSTRMTPRRASNRTQCPRGSTRTPMRGGVRPAGGDGRMAGRRRADTRRRGAVGSQRCGYADRPNGQRRDRPGETVGAVPVRHDVPRGRFRADDLGGDQRRLDPDLFALSAIDGEGARGRPRPSGGWSPGSGRTVTTSTTCTAASTGSPRSTWSPSETRSSRPTSIWSGRRDRPCSRRSWPTSRSPRVAAATGASSAPTTTCGPAIKMLPGKTRRPHKGPQSHQTYSGPCSPSRRLTRRRRARPPSRSPTPSSGCATRPRPRPRRSSARRTATTS